MEDYKFLDGVTVKVAVTSGFKGAKHLLDEVSKGESPYHFIEVMGCPGGCIMGGGQPRSSDPDVKAKRLRGTYDEDESKVLRKSHENPYIAAIYKEYLEHPNSHRAHELLHTHYVKRGPFNELTRERFSKSFVHKPPQGKPAREPTAAKAQPDIKREREDLESVRLLALEADNTRLKNELSDLLETVDILKQVVSDYTNRQT